ncbi:MAG TPA: beta-propeller fold lactonase family protein [Acidimicrobiales bacterium]|nr:beta-propeller fold lactonase family protein [Acidimicrobiales bacterium]
MTRIKRGATTVLLGALALAGTTLGIAGSAAAVPAGAPRTAPFTDHAVFLQTDNPDGNQILAYDQAANGTLSAAGTYDTGGDGAVAAGSAVDPLASQGSVALADGGRILLAVNAGSDTVSVFRVSGDQLALWQIVPSGGQFPTSIAVHRGLVYVLDAGGAGSVQGYALIADALRPLPGSNRSLGLANTDPPNYLESPGQVGFSPDGSEVIVTTKQSGSDIDVFAVGFAGLLSLHPVKNPSATPVPFAFTFDQAGHLVVTEAGTSSLSVYALNPGGTVSALGSVTDGQTALCWVTQDNGFFYGSNAGSATVSSFQVSAGGTPVLLGVAASTEAGTTDSAATPNGRFLYVENGGAGTLDEFHVKDDGTLFEIGTVTGLASPMEGIAAS